MRSQGSPDCGYRRGLKDFAAWFETINGEQFRPERVTPLDVREYKSYLQSVKGYKPSTVNRRLARLEDVTVHTCHSFAHNLVDAGVRLDQVAMLLGHESLDTTARYTRPGEHDLEEAVSRVEWG